MDELDKKILEILQENDRTPYYKIGKRLNVGSTTVHTRVKKMVKKGIIKKFVAIVNPHKVGYPACKIVGLTVQPDKIEEVAEKIAKFDEITMIGTTGGDHDIVFEIIGPDERYIGKFINENIKTIEGVKSGIGMIHISTFTEIYKHDQKISFF
ncbi:MAG: Lrp/AsnC family transcriptional regulator [Candidatus Methanofastidiosia archaeon]